jgi:hypothetical protein
MMGEIAKIIGDPEYGTFCDSGKNSPEMSILVENGRIISKMIDDRMVLQEGSEYVEKYDRFIKASIFGISDL